MKVYVYTFFDKDSGYVQTNVYKNKQTAVEAAVADFADNHDDGIEEMQDQINDYGRYDEERARYTIEIKNLLG